MGFGGGVAVGSAMLNCCLCVVLFVRGGDENRGKVLESCGLARPHFSALGHFLDEARGLLTSCHLVGEREVIIYHDDNNGVVRLLEMPLEACDSIDCSIIT